MRRFALIVLLLAAAWMTGDHPLSAQQNQPEACEFKYRRGIPEVEQAREAKKREMRENGVPERYLHLVDNYECIWCIETAPDTVHVTIIYKEEYAPRMSDGTPDIKYEIKLTPQIERQLRDDLASGRIESFHVWMTENRTGCRCCPDDERKEKDDYDDWNSALELNMDQVDSFDDPSDLPPLPDDLKRAPAGWTPPPPIENFSKPRRRYMHVTCAACQKLADEWNTAAGTLDFLWDRKVSLQRQINNTEHAMGNRRNEINDLEYNQRFDTSRSYDRGRLIDTLKQINADQQSMVEREERELADVDKLIKESEARMADIMEKVVECEKLCRKTTTATTATGSTAPLVSDVPPASTPASQPAASTSRVPASPTPPAGPDAPGTTLPPNNPNLVTPLGAGSASRQPTTPRQVCSACQQLANDLAELQDDLTAKRDELNGEILRLSVLHAVRRSMAYQRLRLGFRDLSPEDQARGDALDNESSRIKSELEYLEEEKIKPLEDEVTQLALAVERLEGLLNDCLKKCEATSTSSATAGTAAVSAGPSTPALPTATAACAPCAALVQDVAAKQAELDAARATLQNIAMNVATLTAALANAVADASRQSSLQGQLTRLNEAMAKTQQQAAARQRELSDLQQKLASCKCPAGTTTATGVNTTGDASPQRPQTALTPEQRRLIREIMTPFTTSAPAVRESRSFELFHEDLEAFRKSMLTDPDGVDPQVRAYLTELFTDLKTPARTETALNPPSVDSGLAGPINVSGDETFPKLPGTTDAGGNSRDYCDVIDCVNTWSCVDTDSCRQIDDDCLVPGTCVTDNGGRYAVRRGQLLDEAGWATTANAEVETRIQIKMGDVVIEVAIQPHQRAAIGSWFNPLGLLARRLRHNMERWHGSVGPRPLVRRSDLEMVEEFSGAQRAGLPKGVHLLLTDSGGSTGKTLAMHVLNLSGESVRLSSRPFVIEPITQQVQQRVQQAFTRLAKAAPVRLDLAGYCLEFMKAPPVANQIFRLAPAAVQKKYEPMSKVLRSAFRVHRSGRLRPDSNPDAYADSIKQWALWAVEQKFNEKRFADAFLGHTRKNVEAAGQQWSKPAEEMVRKVSPNRWRDIVKVLQGAGVPVPR